MAQVKEVARLVGEELFEGGSGGIAAAEFYLEGGYDPGVFHRRLFGVIIVAVVGSLLRGGCI